MIIIIISLLHYTSTTTALHYHYEGNKRFPRQFPRKVVKGYPHDSPHSDIVLHEHGVWNRFLESPWGSPPNGVPPNGVPQELPRDPP